MMIHPVFAIIDPPVIIGIAAVGALLFGADKLPKLARSAAGSGGRLALCASRLLGAVPSDRQLAVTRP